MSNAEKTVLIVDDDPDIVESTRIVLESAGYQVRAATDGAAALKAVEEQPPDLIILDIMMAGPTEGFHVSYELRKDPVYKKIPIVIVSALSEKSGFNFSREKGSDFIQADEYLDKPVHPQKLLNTIARLLEGSRT